MSKSNNNLSGPLPDTYLSWKLYGAGFENLGINGLPEKVPMRLPGNDQILVRIDAVGICYSDVKLLQLGEKHSKLAGVNLKETPTSPGHEISLTVVRVGKHLQDQFFPGQRYAILPEVVHSGKKMTYGFNIPGGLSQYQLIGAELLKTDHGVCLLGLDDSTGYAEACLLEPWGSVYSSYDETRRLLPKRGGKMLIINDPDSPTENSFSTFLDFPELILFAGDNKILELAIKDKSKNVLTVANPKIADYPRLAEEYTEGRGFDDIVLLNPKSAAQVEALIKVMAPGGTINFVGKQPLEEEVKLDASRIHYDFLSLIGNPGPDIAASYDVQRNRADFLPGGTAVMLGAAGPMGQVHVQVAISNLAGPKTIIITDVNQDRLNRIASKFDRLASEFNKSLFMINPASTQENLSIIIKEITGSTVVDDVIVLVPEQIVLNEAASLLHSNSMVNLFAGTPAGINLPVDISDIYLGGLQIKGSSGLSFKHLEKVHKLARQRKININASVAAVGGMEAASDAIQAAERRQFSGKIIIYPQLTSLPLIGLEDLNKEFPDEFLFSEDQRFWSKDMEIKLMAKKFS